MKKRYLTASDYATSTWSGGETKELYLSPSTGAYEVGHFDFRVSSASVELPETTFTALPGYKRQIMSLDFPLSLHHGDSNEKVALEPFEPHYFLGELVTRSKGICHDFNLIYREHFSGDIQPVRQNEEVVIAPQKTYLIYALQEVRIQQYQETLLVAHMHLEEGSSIVVEEVTEGCQFRLTAKKSTAKPIAVVASVIEG